MGDWNVAAETVSSEKVALASGCLVLQQLSVSLGGGRAGGGAWVATGHGLCNYHNQVHVTGQLVASPLPQCIVVRE